MYERTINSSCKSNILQGFITPHRADETGTGYHGAVKGGKCLRMDTENEKLHIELKYLEIFQPGD